ncbi:MAG: hypothetical protein Kow00121_67300 [Elainellaceae cyanobacterium]
MLAVLVLLWVWNWQLVLSGGAGLAMLVFIYLAQQGQWQFPKVNWHKLWSRSNRPLTLALVAGTVTSFSIYLTLAIWLETDGSWLSIAIILEGLGILVILALLGWQLIEKYWGDRTESNPDPQGNQLLTDLSDPDPLKRLIAVRRITDWVTKLSPTQNLPSNSPLSPAHLADCFRLMLNRETEPALCRALLESLQTLSPDRSQTRQLQKGQALPLSTPQRIGEKTSC